MEKKLIEKNNTWSSPRTPEDKKEAVELVTDLLRLLGLDANVIDRANDQDPDSRESEHSACTCVR
ncbi:hypothetical protein ACSRUE_12745 [Sorangium sp. KYC3313]|uniref:hypothetical protein n=1 Tax=Sorangium sp. KYC3313 TaxID=3449740 RepID=UPI003F8AECAC